MCVRDDSAPAAGGSVCAVRPNAPCPGGDKCRAKAAAAAATARAATLTCSSTLKLDRRAEEQEAERWDGMG